MPQTFFPNVMVSARRLAGDRSSLACSAIACTSILWSALPGFALEAKYTPATPKLGETIVISITTDSPTPTSTSKPTPPTVKVGSKSYPAFAVGSGYRAFIPTTPLEKAGTREVTISENGDNKSATTLKINVANRKFPIQRITFSPDKSGIEATAMELKKVGELKATVSPDQLWSGKFIAPNQSRTSTPYGVRRYYNGEFANDYYHRGLDYAGSYGSQIVAPAAGKVVLVGYEKKGFKVHGNVVGVDHGQGVVSIFMHMSRIDVQEGQTVAPGDVLGAVGNTGSSAGPHLHWGLYVNGLSVEPLQWLKNSID